MILNYVSSVYCVVHSNFNLTTTILPDTIISTPHN
jgi:hypothetical protein